MLAADDFGAVHAGEERYRCADEMASKGHGLHTSNTVLVNELTSEPTICRAMLLYRSILAEHRIQLEAVEYLLPTRCTAARVRQRDAAPIGAAASKQAKTTTQELRIHHPSPSPPYHSSGSATDGVCA